MGYVCMDCGQAERFNTTQQYTEWGIQNITIDGEGEVIDWGDQEASDSEIDEGPENLNCVNCNSEHINLYNLPHFLISL